MLDIKSFFVNEKIIMKRLDLNLEQAEVLFFSFLQQLLLNKMWLGRFLTKENLNESDLQFEVHKPFFLKKVANFLISNDDILSSYLDSNNITLNIIIEASDIIYDPDILWNQRS